MTWYFDDKTTKLNEIEEVSVVPPDGLSEHGLLRLRNWEQDLVRDVMVASQLGMPEGPANKILDVILAHGVDTLPPGLRSLDNIETLADHFHQMDRLVFRLHTAFHELARNHKGWSDSPLGPISALHGQAENKLMERAPEDRKYCPLCGDRGGLLEPCEACGAVSND